MGLTWGSGARASLGGDVASIALDAAALGASPLARAAPGFTVHEIDGPSAMQVREFVDDRGVVFGVGWSGPAQPDLRQLLGAYFARYTDALAALDHPGVHRSVRIASPELVVESSGHLRAFHGLAYLPARLPAGVTPEQLR